MTAGRDDQPGQDARDLALGLALAALASGIWVMLTVTGKHDDPFDSPYYWWTWLLMPGVSLAAAAGRPARPRPFRWTAALVLPWMLMLAVQGMTSLDSDGLWIVGEVFLVAQGAVVLGAAFLGARVGRSIERPRLIARDSPATKKMGRTWSTPRWWGS